MNTDIALFIGVAICLSWGSWHIGNRQGIESGWQAIEDRDAVIERALASFGPSVEPRAYAACAMPFVTPMESE